jgi:DNA repair protein RecO (recombination protein O)
MGAAMLRDTGVVLRTIKLGEADRIVSILTAEHGKIRGVAKGARKSGSKYSARLESGSVVDFQWIPSSKELVRLTQTDTVFAHRHIREDLDLLNASARMLDAVDALCEDHSSHNDLAKMTMKALSTLNQTKNPSVCGVFLFKVLSLEGFSPDATSCPGCEKREGLTHFSLDQGAYFCDDCATGAMVETLAHTRTTMMAILDGKTSAVLENIPADVAHELETLAIAMIEHHSGRSLRAVTV